MKPAWEWDEADLLRMIADKEPEGIHLDYKRSAALAKDERKKDELSKDVAAFANSDGGVLIYGIAENVDHLPEQLDEGTDPANINKEWIEQVINSRIQRRISGIRINDIALSHSPGRFAYVISVPQSSDAPHQSNDKRYYKRFNFESVPMHDYEVRDVARRANSPQLTFDITIRMQFAHYNNRAPVVSFFFDLAVINSGKASARDLFVTFDCNPPANPPIGRAMPDWKYCGLSGRTYGYAAFRPIHPGERCDVLGNIEIPHNFTGVGENHEVTLADVPIWFDLRAYATDQVPCSACLDFSGEPVYHRKDGVKPSIRRTGLARP